MQNTALEKAITLAGGQTALAALISTDEKPFRQSHVWSWLRRDKKLSPQVALLIERATDGSVTRSELCPEFPWADLV